MSETSEKSFLHQRFKVIEGLDDEELHKWRLQEVAFWDAIDQKISYARQGHGPNQQFITASTLKAIKNYTHSLRTAGIESSRKELLDILINAKLPFHDESIPSKIEEYAAAPQLFEGALFTFKLALENELTAHKELYENKLEKFASETNKTIDSLLDNFKTETAKFTEEQAKSTAESKAECDTAASESIKEITKVLAAGREAVTLSEPVKYWEERKEIHHLNAKKYGRYSIASAAIFLCLLVALIIYEYASGKSVNLGGLELNLPRNAFSVAFLLIFTSAGIWCTRIFIKLMMTNIALESESLERATMIKTYVAMSAVSGTPDSDKQTLFYTTLFRPTQSAFTEDGTAPEFSRVLEIIMKK